jgi:hypothetical protein
MFNLFREVFTVGYNDGLQGAKDFATYAEALAEAQDAVTIAQNITVRDRKGTLLAQFD